MTATATADGLEDRIERWWRLFAVALFLLVPLDLLTTLLVVTRYGTVVEANPLMRWLLDQGLLVVTATNLGVVVLVVLLFQAAIRRIRQTPPAYHRAVTRVVDVWVGVLLVAGTVLVANNLAVLL
ncbi:hypothetical protein HWV23_15665 [Natronomonas halophila]|uniref:DUF5658 family protein n=1 Tax=Natronomonas halophila TaxID=2747817 RepID=UPI0015B57A2C|nr:DUF5658 family protein [Natronomonas halophila]QLD87099.1 hypothetical protein HWV23_15665 [Natronomonas halophila]